MLRTVGDAAGPVASERDNPVEEVPKVMGSDVVWRVSLGLMVGRRLLVTLDDRLQDRFE